MTCRFVGFSNYKQDLSISKNIGILKEMTNALNPSILGKNDYYISEHTNLGCKKLINKSEEHKNPSLQVKYHDNFYAIVYDGNLYNSKEIGESLIQNGYDVDFTNEAEIILKAFLFKGTSIFKKFNGVFSFAIWNEVTQELIICRDQFGIKPLYYAILEDTFIFSSEIKAILQYPGVKAKINKQGICELLGIGPAHTPGTCVFEDIYEIKPGHFGIWNKDGFKTICYWKMETQEHTDNFEITCKNIHNLLNDSIQKQLVSDVPLCAMLSGGVDSSLIVAYASQYLKEKGLPPLDTFSIDYVDNDKNFVKSDFQPNSDNYYIDLMLKEFNTNHHPIVIDTPELASFLEDAMIARDFPGMADVDSSILLFCKYIKKQNFTVALSGECSDEIFAGYPWFFREDALKSGTFPWSIAISERQNLLNTDIGKEIKLKQYIEQRYQESIQEIEFLDSDSKDTKEKRIISYLTIQWFMTTLLDRADRMSTYSGLEIRVPICDYRLVQYMWNVPWEMKALGGREKGLLRYVVKDLLPDEIVNRKKSPYPKTHNPTYLKAVKEMLIDIMNKPNAPINDLLNKKYILDIVNTDGKSFTRPWFGQLMTGPQLMAYLCQVNMWLEKYSPKIELT